MTDSDTRTEVTIYKHKTGMYDKEESQIILKSNTENIDDLIKKAKEALNE